MKDAVGAVVGPLARRWAGHRVQRLLGFWVLWHSYGNLSRLVDAGILARSGVYTQRKEFRKVFGVNVEDWHPEIGEEMRAGRRVTAGGNVE